jgi:hypothetical protein
MFDHNGIGFGPAIAVLIAVVLIVVGRRLIRRRR